MQGLNHTGKKPNSKYELFSPLELNSFSKDDGRLPPHGFVVLPVGF